jgi:16S rRNA (adenine1518-N6/adenine1519-N6)-dimethyltransferase
VTLTRRQVHELLESNGLRPSRALGQNFVADPNTVRRIAALADVGTGDGVVEIGAGLGSLTLALADTGARVVAVEADRRLVDVLRRQVEGRGVDVVHGDALELDFGALLGAASDWALVANLPYNVAVPLVARVLDDVPAVGRLLVMVQREVGERLAAGPGSRAYGAVSVKVAYHAEARVVGSVPASVFVPRPRVESVLVRIVRRPRVAVDPAVVPADRLFAVVRAGFAHRRKMLRRALAGVVDTACFATAGVDERARAEELSVEQWGRLAACSA